MNHSSSKYFNPLRQLSKELCEASCLVSSPVALKSPVYRYVVTHTPSSAVNTSVQDLVPFPSRFSFHMLDSLAFFGGLEAFLEKPLSAKDKEFQDLYRHHLVHFAKEGRTAAI